MDGSRLVSLENSCVSQQVVPKPKQSVMRDKAGMAFSDPILSVALWRRQGPDCKRQACSKRISRPMIGFVSCFLDMVCFLSTSKEIA